MLVENCELTANVLFLIDQEMMLKFIYHLYLAVYLFIYIQLNLLLLKII